ncbi:hypothetical protein GCM10010171_02100 [Actinokineospora fastidiosa]|uniref:Uncharacterized protein n=1 Tax=Actinokineospora fastidiosa TaxID=1816 RepID=A0A918G2C4_9PSEU|nr:hypothetical protein GCM10010171_02100 [Actinokineospora fastidiosa]
MLDVVEVLMLPPGSTRDPRILPDPIGPVPNDDPVPLVTPERPKPTVTCTNTIPARLTNPRLRR